MKALITGMSGTVAPAVSRALTESGHAVARWDRAAVPIDNPAAMRDFIAAERPDCFLHAATGSPDWAEGVARACAALGVKFLFTSSVSVFSDSQRGPFSTGTPPEAADDYGRYKIECERRVRAANPRALIARLGWQIGSGPGSNNIVDFLHRAATREGRIEASTRWLPACSFLEDTADGLRRLLDSGSGGLYHLDGNPGLSFYEVVAGLNRLRGEAWTVVAGEDPSRNGLMTDERIAIEPITRRLGARPRS